MTGKLDLLIARTNRRAMGLGGIVVALIVASPRLAPGQETPELSQDPLAGAQVFQGKGCARCHSVDGLGGSWGPDLGRTRQRRSFHELAATLWNHTPHMDAEMEEQGIVHPEMTAREAADLIGFLFTLHYFDPPGNLTLGKYLFTQKKCFVCHRVGEYGGDVGPNLNFVGQYGSPILVAASMWNHGAPMAEIMEERGVVRPAFHGSELIDLITYIGSVAVEPLEGHVYVLPGRAEAGRTVFLEKRCNECHSVQGVGGRSGPDLAERRRQWGLTEFAAAMWNKAPAMLEAMEGRGLSVTQIGGGEMADLVAYLYYIEYFAEPGDAELGEQLLQEKSCLTCHALGGSGGTTAADLAWVSGLGSPAAAIASLWNHSVKMAAAPAAEERSFPTLSAEDMANLMAFLEELDQGR
ncbi:MAG: c-type cytochrome [Gemmatimonadota bacterium]|nr:MAG: c-type cytochrome [Gemmatimonadota bacterium]